MKYPLWYFFEYTITQYDICPESCLYKTSRGEIYALLQIKYYDGLRKKSHLYSFTIYYSFTGP